MKSNFFRRMEMIICDQNTNENQEKELRITEIVAILENELYENEVEEHCLEIELQFLQGNKIHMVNPMHSLEQV